MEHKHNIAAVSILFARRESILKRFFPMIGDDISRDTAKFDYESVLAKMRGMTPQEAAAAAAQAVAEAEVALDEAEEALREAEAAEADAKVDEAFAEAAACRALRKRKAREMKRRLMGSGA